MKSTYISIPLLALFQGVAAAAVQRQDIQIPSAFRDYKDVVKGMFTDSYSTYTDYAWGHDDVCPITYSDGRNGWGATIVDAMSTMYIMGLKETFNEAVAHVSNVNFTESVTNDSVSVFETTIRYMGGLLSAYELSGRQSDVLLHKAQDIADKLAFAWIGSNDIPFGHIDFTKNTPIIATSNIAEAGTLSLEWATLSKYTGNDTYRQLAEKAARHIVNNGAPFSGLPAQGIDPATGQPVGSLVTWGGGSDSYFEYLIKYARLTNNADALFADSWRTAVDSSIRTLMETSSVGNHIYLTDYDSRPLHSSSHLACFHGGNWLLGGRLLNNDTIVQIGLELVDSCWNTYASTATGIGPETFAYFTTRDQKGSPTGSIDLAFYAQHGYYVTASDYVLRPEVLESNFYAWRVTGDTKYLDRAANATQSFRKYLAVGKGYAGLLDVTNVNSEKIDDMESFWFAEVLKYLYLTFDDPTNISLDEYVFNTEAHPIAAPPLANTYYGSGELHDLNKPFKTNSGELPKPSSSNSLFGIPDLLSGL